MDKRYARDDQEQDEVLKKALQHIYAKIEIPDSTESWERVQALLQRKKHRLKWGYRLKISSYILLGSLVLNAVLATTTPTTYSNIGALFIRIQQNMIQIFHEKPKEPDLSAAKTSPPPDYPIETQERATSGSMGSLMFEVTMEEAIERVPYLLIPTEIPDRFHLNRVRIFGQHEEGPYENVHMEYLNDDGEVLHIIQHQILGETTGVVTSMNVDTGEYKGVTVNGKSAVLMVPTVGNIHMEWLTDERVLIRISGNLSESEIMSLAASLESHQ